MAYDWWWPAGWGVLAGLGAIAIIISILLLLFWIWMIVDCARRNFRNDVEKWIWLAVIILGSTLGALLYLLIIRMSNPAGLSRAPSTGRTVPKRRNV